MELPTQVIFASEKIKKQFEDIQEKEFRKQLEEIFAQLKKNAFSGIQIPKKLIPKEYMQKYNIRNLWKYNLRNGWRLLYSIENQQEIVVSIIIEWLDHKEYERRLKY